MVKIIVLAKQINCSFHNQFYTKFISKIKKAFTLAEVLVTLTIIGVVAAITVPTVSRNTTNMRLLVH